MNAREFFELTAQMREAQRNFFRNRQSQAYLDHAKRLERMVDAEILRVRAVLNDKGL